MKVCINRYECLIEFNNLRSVKLSEVRGRQNFQLPAGAVFAAWKSPLQNRKLRRTKHALEGCVHRAVTKVVDLNNLVGYKKVRSQKVFGLPIKPIHWWGGSKFKFTIFIILDVFCDNSVCPAPLP